MIFLKNKIVIFLLPLAIFWTFFFLCRTQYNALWLILFFMCLFYLPGFSLSKIFRSQNENISSQIAQTVTLGFIWNLFIALIAIIVGINIHELMFLYLLGTNALWLTSFFLNHETKLKIKTNFPKISNLLYLTPISLILLMIFLFLFSKGAIFEQEAFFHLSTMRKAIEGAPLSPANLSFVRTEGLHSIYGFPIWHVFLALFAKLSNTSIFNVWRILPIPLIIFSILFYYRLFHVIFKNNFLAIGSVTLFFASLAAFENSYMFTRIAIPNSLSFLIFFPMILSLVIDFIFEKMFELRQFILSIIMIAALFLIHALQPIYLIIILFSLWLLIIGLKIFDSNWGPPLKKLSILIATFFGISALILALKMTCNHDFIRHIIGQLNTNTFGVHNVFNHFNLYTKISFLFFLFLIFILRNKRISVILAVFLILPLLYAPFSSDLRQYFLKIFGDIFFYRLDAFVNWDYAIWAVIVMVFSTLATKIRFLLKDTIRKVLDFAVILALFLLPFLAVKSKLFSDLNKDVFNSLSLSGWLNNHYYILFSTIIGFVLIVLLWQIKISFVRISDSYKINVLLGTFFLMLLSFVLLSPTTKFTLMTVKNTDYKEVFLNPGLMEKKINLNIVGGQDSLKFIRNHIPSKSVILANGYAGDVLPLLTDNFSASYPRSAKEKLPKRVYLDITEKDKMEIIEKLDIQYIFFGPDMASQAKKFENKTFYKKIYDGESKIFEIQKKTL